MALRKANIVSKLLTFAGNITYTHCRSFYIQVFIVAVFTP